MLTPIGILRRELLNHCHFLDDCRDPQVAGYAVEEVKESKKQIRKLEEAIKILEKAEEKGSETNGDQST